LVIATVEEGKDAEVLATDPRLRWTRILVAVQDRAVLVLSDF